MDREKQLLIHIENHCQNLSEPEKERIDCMGKFSKCAVCE